MTEIIYDDGRTRIYGRYIGESSNREEKKRLERRAVEEMVKEIFGPDAEYSHHDDGAPKIISQSYKGSISVSHGGGMALIAISNADSVGVDVEAPREQLARVAHKFMEHPTADIKELLRAWTIKEALYKAARIPGLPLMEIPAQIGKVDLRGKSYHVHTIEKPSRTIAIAWQIGKNHQM